MRRAQLEQEVEVGYRERLEVHCGYERRQQRQLLYREGRDKASAMPTPNCDKLSNLLRTRPMHAYYSY